MLRRDFLSGAAASLAFLGHARDSGIKLADAARKQLNITTGYDPKYVRMAYPGGDVPRVTGVCADVIVRAARDGLGLDLQKLIHEDMARDFAAYPKTWGMQHPDANIDHRRVLNLEVFWRRAGAAVWTAQGLVAGNAFPGPLEPGDLLTWLLGGKLPHVGIVVETGMFSTRIVHNIGGGVQEDALFGMREQQAKGHYRWPTA
jgi:uncharacterized protein YijF (DUF1287 family)